MFGSSKPSGLIVSGSPWSGATVWPDLQLPDDGELLAEAVLVEGLQPHDVREAGLGLVGGLRGRALGLDVGDGPGGTADVDDLALLREGRNDARRSRHGSFRTRMHLPLGRQPIRPLAVRRVALPSWTSFAIFANRCRVRLMQGISDRVLSLIEASGLSRRAFAQDDRARRLQAIEVAQRHPPLLLPRPGSHRRGMRASPSTGWSPGRNRRWRSRPGRPAERRAPR